MNPLIDAWILKTLQEELEIAKQRHQKARENFWKVTERPRELPARDRAHAHLPEGKLKVQEAIAEETTARKAHLDALIRINDYLIRGKVPGHLRKKDTSDESQLA